MSKRELKSNLGKESVSKKNFDINAYLEDRPIAETIVEKIETSVKIPESSQENKEEIKINRKAKPLKTKINMEDKIPFMNYLPPDLHEKFSYLYLEAKLNLRSKTKKALSQTELVEAILQCAVDNWGAQKAQILETAEVIISGRRTKD